MSAAAGSAVQTDQANPTGPGNGGFDKDLVLRRVVPITHDVSSFVFERPPGWQGEAVAGQHLILTCAIDGTDVERCYTIASPPTRGATLTLTVKRQPDGVVSPWLHDVVRPGDRIRARGPFGEFTRHAHPAQATETSRDGAFLFLSAGSGITPLMSMTRELADRASDADVVFVHSARAPGDIIFRRELAALAESGLAVRVLSVCEQDHPADRWDGPLGRLDEPLLRWLVPDATEREVFVCGPPGYMTATGDLLDRLGVDPERVHRESFTVAEVTDLFDSAADEPEGMLIELRASGRTVRCGAESTVLQAVEQAGVVLRSSCRQGLCGTCKLTLVEGEVDMRHQGGIRPREIAQGGFLPCSSRPMTDLVIDA